MRKITGKYRNTCRICKGAIAVGEEIAYLRQDGEAKVAHWACFVDAMSRREEEEDGQPRPEAETEHNQEPAPEQAPEPEPMKDDDLPF